MKKNFKISKFIFQLKYLKTSIKNELAISNFTSLFKWTKTEWIMTWNKINVFLSRFFFHFLACFLTIFFSEQFLRKYDSLPREFSEQFLRIWNDCEVISKNQNALLLWNTVFEFTFQRVWRISLFSFGNQPLWDFWENQN